MSKKDIEKGIEIQAKADAERVKKESAALEQIMKTLKEMKGSQSSLRKTVGIVLEDMNVMNLRTKYGLNSMSTPLDLDDDIKNFLLSVLFSLFDEEESISEYQREYYKNLEKYLGVANRNPDCDYAKLNNIDSHTDRMVVLEAICSFLFLSKCEMSFVNDEKYSWIHDFATSKNLDTICEIIQKEYDTLGAEGIVTKYRKHEIEPSEDKLEEAEDEKEIDNESVEEQPNIDPYSALKTLVVSYIADESSFGKNQNNSPATALRDIKKSFPDLGTNAIISISKIENGYLFFTTAALYLKTTDKFNARYLRIPYRNINVDNIFFGLGKIKGTRKIVIPYQDENGIEKSAVIDDAKLTEEKLGDLLKAIKKSNIEIASNDMYVDLPGLSLEEKELYFMSLGNILVREEYNLAELYLVMMDYGMDSSWDDIASSFNQNDSLESNIKTFLDNIPYPSKDRISQQAMLLALQTICRTNRIEGAEISTLYDEDEKLIRLFDTSNTDQIAFNKLLSVAASSERKINLNDIFYIIDRLSKTTLYYENIIKGENAFVEVIKAEIERKKNSFPNKVINVVEEKGGELVDFAGDVLKKVKLPIGNKNREKIIIPAEYKKGKKIPAEYGLPKDAESFITTSENGIGTLIMHEVTEEQTMPFDNPQWVIDTLHSSMGENEGIIEVNNGTTAGGKPYIYEIIKHHFSNKEEGLPGKMEYTLNINVRFENSIQFINGSFVEGNTTGVRESVIYAAYMKTKNDKPDEVTEWLYDPYDSDYTKGLRMNVSEKASFDENFPWHPLSMCRKLVEFIINNN